MKCSALEQTPRVVMGNHAVITPTTMAANAPRVLSTFLDPPLLLLLVLLEEPEAVGLPVPVVEVLEPPDPGVAEGSG